MKKLIIIVALVSPIAFADVYKCTGPDGGIKFQKLPCAGNPDAKPMDIKQPSPAMLEKIKREAVRQQIADEEWRKRKMEEEKHQAELNAIRAREAASDELKASIRQSRIESAEREARWEHEDYCRTRTRINPSDGC